MPHHTTSILGFLRERSHVTDGKDVRVAALQVFIDKDTSRAGVEQRYLSLGEFDVGCCASAYDYEVGVKHSPTLEICLDDLCQT